MIFPGKKHVKIGVSSPLMGIPVEVALAARPTPPVWRWVSATAAARRIRSRTPAARQVLAPARRIRRGKTHEKSHRKNGAYPLVN